MSQKPLALAVRQSDTTTPLSARRRGQAVGDVAPDVSRRLGLQTAVEHNNPLNEKWPGPDHNP